ncbi:hypothetical protein [Haloferula rosea]|uniref:Uncharacterized protein n=1 Tax=Haloferula rosea TaxID=490093 RepID=A0A934RDW3_9BACT|nr:hypothetical protein [Haloferula rosea]MBK1827291.1 hypothetical protein [Haloferula rosea]
MKLLATILTSLCLCGAAQAAPPSIINYQGRVSVNGENFDGTGLFKFALVDAVGSTSYWGNDGTGAAGGEPTAAVSLPVNKGLYAVGLGDTALGNMTEVPASIFAGQDDVRLRVWFDDGVNGSIQLVPDQRITSVGYALSAAQADSVADGSITGAKLADGAVSASKFAPSILSAQSGESYAYALNPSGELAVSVAFDQAFPPGTIPEVELPAGWVLSGAASSTGFSATNDSPTFGTAVADSSAGSGQFTSLALVDGRPAISQYNATTGDLTFVIAVDAGATSWNPPVVVDSAGDVGAYNSLAVVDGRPAISYFDDTNDDLKYVIADDASGTTWGTPVTVDFPGSVGTYTTLKVVNGRPAISYYRSDAGDLKYVRANDATGATWPVPGTVASFNDVGQYASMEIVNGRPAISFFDATEESLYYVRAGNEDGSFWGGRVLVDQGSAIFIFSPEAGRYTSLAVISGRPAISYTSGSTTSSDLAYKRANNSDGTSWGPRIIVDSAGANGPSTSLVEINGRPAIAYYSPTADLRYVVASDSVGGTWMAPQVIDSVGDVGREAALALIDGRPAISYSDRTNGQLKYATLAGPESWTATTGDIAPILATGVASGGITASMLGNDAVSGSSIADGSVGSADIADGSVGSADIADGSVGSADIADGSVGSADIADGSVGSADIADGSVGSAAITDGSITAADLSGAIGVWTQSGGNVHRTTGNVGIGLSNPSTALEVNGTVKATAFIGAPSPKGWLTFGPGSSSWVCPPNVTTITLDMRGGNGGGGGGSSGNSGQTIEVPNPFGSFTTLQLGGSGGGSGGEGAYLKIALPVTPGETYTLEVGSGGMGGALGAAGVAGGVTQFKLGSTVLATVAGGGGGGAGSIMSTILDGPRLLGVPTAGGPAGLGGVSPAIPLALAEDGGGGVAGSSANAGTGPGGGTYSGDANFGDPSTESGAGGAGRRYGNAARAATAGLQGAPGSILMSLY